MTPGYKFPLHSMRDRQWPIITWLTPFVLAMVPSVAAAEQMTVTAFNDLAKRCGSSVAPSTLAAIAKTESGFRTLVVSDNHSGRAKNFDALPDAIAHANMLIALGHSIDMGLMQINSANLRRLGYSTRDALDPCRSVAGGALILSRNYASIRNVANPQVALRHALSQYNTGNIRGGYRNGYVRRVEQSARSLRFAVEEPTAALTRVRAVAPPTHVLSAGWDIWGNASPKPELRTNAFLVF